MNTIQAISGNPFVSDKLFFGPSVRTNYLWKNLIVEKRISMSRLYKLTRHILLYDFWSVLPSPAH